MIERELDTARRKALRAISTAATKAQRQTAMGNLSAAQEALQEGVWAVEKCRDECRRIAEADDPGAAEALREAGLYS